MSPADAGRFIPLSYVLWVETLMYVLTPVSHTSDMFCSNFVFQRSVFPHDEVTPLAVAPFSASPDAVVLDKIRADVALLRSKLGKKLKDLSDDAEVLLSDYRKLAEQANKRAKDAGEDFGIKVTSSGTIWRVGETR